MGLEHFWEKRNMREKEENTSLYLGKLIQLGTSKEHPSCLRSSLSSQIFSRNLHHNYFHLPPTR